MRVLEQFLKPTQGQLFKMLCKMFGGKKIFASHKRFLLVEGEVPIMLVAHLDTVHKEPVRDICKSKDRNILMSPQGIGGDDRCGVYALVNAYEMSSKKPWLLFTTDEEIGCVGAEFFCRLHQDNKLPAGVDELKLLVEIDRRGANDAVYYECANDEFERYITGKGFKTAYGSFSDISHIAPELGVAAVNLSSGYYNAHTLSEYINRAELDDVLRRVIEIISDAAKTDFPKYAYVEKAYAIHDDWYYCGNGKWGRGKTISSYSWQDSKINSKVPEKVEDKVTPKQLPSEYQDLYDELVTDFGYDVEELEYMRECYGDRVIYDLYIEEAGPFYQTTAEGATITAVADK